MLKKYLFIILTYATCLGLLITAFILGTKYNIPFSHITGDMALIFNAHPFTGIISNIGVLVWCATACICFFSGIVLRKLKQNLEAKFLIGSGFISFILLIDDFFMFHDYILYSFKAFKITQSITYVFYAILVFWYTASFVKLIFKETIFYVLGIAFTFLGSSVFIDFFLKNETNMKYFIEDSFKFIGIFSWMLYFTLTSYKFLLRSFTKLRN
ncbi:hypothetical protein CLV33_10237 [Jejuia pallidilutea]|uniref:DUF998 domain-containing protein n=1 Tax=Jejuia pallidilutea TaxID=504487 RepID=A0A362XE88_9FLAO|nr:hypothetical protein [Jejuia pallidilutea]PQV50180.1 hypothetical protein CLV33_10237 [Jejuia pallidilutea]